MTTLGAGVGLDALLGAGSGSGDLGGVGVGNDGDGLGVGVTTLGAGVGLDALLGAGGSGGDLSGVGVGAGCRGDVAQSQGAVSVGNQSHGHFHVGRDPHLLSSAGGGVVELTGGAGNVGLSHVPVDVVAGLDEDIALLGELDGELAVDEAVGTHILVVFFTAVVLAVDVTDQVVADIAGVSLATDDAQTVAVVMLFQLSTDQTIAGDGFHLTVSGFGDGSGAPLGPVGPGLEGVLQVGLGVVLAVDFHHEPPVGVVAVVVADLVAHVAVVADVVAGSGSAVESGEVDELVFLLSGGPVLLMLGVAPVVVQVTHDLVGVDLQLGLVLLVGGDLLGDVVVLGVQHVGLVEACGPGLDVVNGVVGMLHPSGAVGGVTLHGRLVGGSGLVGAVAVQRLVGELLGIHAVGHSVQTLHQQLVGLQDLVEAALGTGQVILCVLGTGGVGDDTVVDVTGGLDGFGVQVTALGTGEGLQTIGGTGSHGGDLGAVGMGTVRLLGGVAQGQGAVLVLHQSEGDLEACGDEHLLGSTALGVGEDADGTIDEGACHVPVLVVAGLDKDIAVLGEGGLQLAVHKAVDTGIFVVALTAVVGTVDVADQVVADVVGIVNTTGGAEAVLVNVVSQLSTDEAVAGDGLHLAVGRGGGGSGAPLGPLGPLAEDVLLVVLGVVLAVDFHHEPPLGVLAVAVVEAVAAVAGVSLVSLGGGDGAVESVEVGELIVLLVFRPALRMTLVAPVVVQVANDLVGVDLQLAGGALGGNDLLAQVVVLGVQAAGLVEAGGPALDVVDGVAAAVNPLGADLGVAGHDGLQRGQNSLGAVAVQGLIGEQLGVHAVGDGVQALHQILVGLQDFLEAAGGTGQLVGGVGLAGSCVDHDLVGVTLGGDGLGVLVATLGAGVGLDAGLQTVGGGGDLGGVSVLTDGLFGNVAQGQAAVGVDLQGEGDVLVAGNQHLLAGTGGGVEEGAGGAADISLGHVPSLVAGGLDADVAVGGELDLQAAVYKLVGTHVFMVFFTAVVLAVDVAEEIVVNCLGGLGFNGFVGGADNGLRGSGGTVIGGSHSCGGNHSEQAQHDAQGQQRCDKSFCHNESPFLKFIWYYADYILLLY